MERVPVFRADQTPDEEGMREVLNQSSSRSASKPLPMVRCGIYTRKSTTEGLDSDFNTLDAQREACQAYIASQRSEGWLALSEHYDDGGFTGANIERPALQQLLAEMKSGQIDCVVVYKVDRLSRSLLDFAKLMEVFDRYHVAFVSVTQQFNTANSMGRLVLNVLLSFAQFEREIISERTSDKMCAARRKGKWLGGPPVLGYDVDRERKRLVVIPDEALIVRQLFSLYLEKKSMLLVAQEANRQGWTTKSHITKKGKVRAGLPFDKARLQRILANVTYAGKVKHKGQILAGEQPALVDEQVFRQVQELIHGNRHAGGKAYRHVHHVLLKRLLRCGNCGAAMAHTYAKKGNRLYRYYLCTTKQKQGPQACDAPFLPAHEIEACVVALLTRIGRDPELIAQAVMETRRRHEAAVAACGIRKIQIQQESQSRQVRIARLMATVKNTTDPPRSVLEQLRADEDLADQDKRRLEEVEEEQLRMTAEAVDSEHLVDALTRFESLWGTLVEDEQAQLLHGLLKSVLYNPVNGEVTLEFGPRLSI
jgi:site-specific DNA recombinase